MRVFIYIEHNAPFVKREQEIIRVRARDAWPRDAQTADISQNFSKQQGLTPATRNCGCGDAPPRERKPERKGLTPNVVIKHFMAAFIIRLAFSRYIALANLSSNVHRLPNLQSAEESLLLPFSIMENKSDGSSSLKNGSFFGPWLKNGAQICKKRATSGRFRKKDGRVFSITMGHLSLFASHSPFMCLGEVCKEEVLAVYTGT